MSEAIAIDRQWSIPKETTEWGYLKTHYHRHDDDVPVEEGYHRARWPDGTELTIEVFYKPLEIPVSEMGHDDTVDSERAYFNLPIHGAVVELPLAASGIELEVLSEEDRCTLELDPNWIATRAENCQRRLNEVDKECETLKRELRTLRAEHTRLADSVAAAISDLSLRAFANLLQELADALGPRLQWAQRAPETK